MRYWSALFDVLITLFVCHYFITEEYSLQFGCFLLVVIFRFNLQDIENDVADIKKKLNETV